MKDHRLAVGRVFLLATLLALLPAPVASQGDSATVQVVRIIDGDTIEVCCVFGDRVKVRYIGIDTPEIHHPMKGVEPYGKEAVETNRKLVDGKTVRLEFDVEQRDKYGRILAYVYLEDGTFVDAWLSGRAARSASRASSSGRAPISEFYFWTPTGPPSVRSISSGPSAASSSASAASAHNGEGIAVSCRSPHGSTRRQLEGRDRGAPRPVNAFPIPLLAPYFWRQGPPASRS